MSQRPTDGPTVIDVEEIQDAITRAWAIGELLRKARQEDPPGLDDPLLLHPTGHEPGPTIDFLTTALWLQSDVLQQVWLTLQAWQDAQEAAEPTPLSRGRQGRKGAPPQAPADPEVRP